MTNTTLLDASASSGIRFILNPSAEDSIARIDAAIRVWLVRDRVDRVSKIDEEISLLQVGRRSFRTQVSKAIDVLSDIEFLLIKQACRSCSPEPHRLTVGCRNRVITYVNGIYELRCQNCRSWHKDLSLTELRAIEVVPHFRTLNLPIENDPLKD